MGLPSFLTILEEAPKAHGIVPWDAFCILFIIGAFLLSFLTMWLSKKYIKTDKVFNIVILVFAVLFVAMELTHEIGRYKELGQYDWSSFPFQLCSVSMYFTIAVPFIKEGKVKNAFIMFFGLFTFLSGILPLIFGQGNLTRWPDLIGVLFSFVWHTLLMLVGAVAIGYKNIGHSLKEEYVYVLSTFAIFFGITCIAQLLNVIIHYGAGGWPLPADLPFKEADYRPDYILDPDSASLFYISPYFKSNIPVVFGDIWTKAGWFVCWLVYVLAFSFGGALVYFVVYGIRQLIDLIVRKIDERRNRVEE